LPLFPTLQKGTLRAELLCGTAQLLYSPLPFPFDMTLYKIIM
jgi:hypothetical protein